MEKTYGHRQASLVKFGWSCRPYGWLCEEAIWILKLFMYILIDVPRKETYIWLQGSPTVQTAHQRGAFTLGKLWWSFQSSCGMSTTDVYLLLLTNHSGCKGCSIGSYCSDDLSRNAIDGGMEAVDPTTFSRVPNHKNQGRKSHYISALCRLNIDPSLASHLNLSTNPPIIQPASKFCSIPGARARSTRALLPHPEKWAELILTSHGLVEPYPTDRYYWAFSTLAFTFLYNDPSIREVMNINNIFIPVWGSTRREKSCCTMGRIVCLYRLRYREKKEGQRCG
jgi:hypothetical protein